MKALGHRRKQKAKINVFPLLPPAPPPQAHAQNVSHGHSVKQVDAVNAHTQAIPQRKATARDSVRERQSGG